VFGEDMLKTVGLADVFATHRFSSIVNYGPVHATVQDGVDILLTKVRRISRTLRRSGRG
jgi:hypothetical protein